MVQFGIFIYGLLAMFVLQSMHRNRRLARPNAQMVTAVGWGLFSMSTALAVLFGALAVALLIGVVAPPLAGL